MSHSNNVLQFFTVLIIFIGVLVITYLTTRYIARYQKTQNSGKNLELIDTCKIAPGKYIQIVRAGDKYLALGIGKDEVSMLCEISEEQLSLGNEAKNGNMDFATIFNKIKKSEPSSENKKQED